MMTNYFMSKQLHKGILVIPVKEIFSVPRSSEGVFCFKALGGLPVPSRHVVHNFYSSQPSLKRANYIEALV